MKNKPILYILLLIIIFTGTAPGAQDPPDKDEGPRFIIDTFIRAFDAPDSGSLSISMRIPHKNLLFIREGESYRGQVDIAVNVYSDGVRVGGFSDMKIITVTAVDQKADLNYTRDFPLPYGNYDIKAVVTDINTQKKRSVDKKADLSILDTDGWSMGHLYPLRLKNSEKDTLNRFVHFGFSASGQEGVHDFRFRIINAAGKEVSSGSFKMQLYPEARDYSIAIPADSLQYREYKLEISTVIVGRKYIRTIPFLMRWTGMNRQIVNLDEAVQQMRYLMMTNFIKREQYDLIENSTGDQQRNAFTEFWKSIDPTPGTDVNELMNEYYRRINESNMSFGSHRSGWETDRGMVYVLFGPPDDREIHNFELNTRPYIIWYYYNLNKYFVFVDYGGFGDFQLNQPIFDHLY